MKTWIWYGIIVLIFFVSCKEKRNKPAGRKISLAVTDTALKWSDYRIGEPPPEGYYYAFDSVIKKWHIRYQRIEGGCEATPEERSRYEKDNPQYFRILERRFGKDWLQRFHAEVETLNRAKQSESKMARTK